LTVGDANSRNDERRHARAVVSAVGSVHEEISPPSVPSLETRGERLRHFDEPFADTSLLKSELLYGAARRKVTVALSGDGGDELFFGYRFYHRAIKAQHVALRARQGPVEAGLRRLAARVGLRRWQIDQRPMEEYLIRTRTIIPDPVRRSFYRGTRLESLPDPLPGTVYLQDLWTKAERAVHGEPFRTMMLVDLLSFLPECGLVKVDRMSMRHGLEVRVPFLANEVVDLLRRLPTSRKIWYRGSRPIGGKRVLREFLFRTVPDLDTARRKQGFGARTREFFDCHGRSSVEAIFGMSPVLAEWCDPEAVRKSLDHAAETGVRHDEAIIELLVLADFLNAR
jgi:asparagine synthase (glutamine-hydrolysing)